VAADDTVTWQRAYPWVDEPRGNGLAVAGLVCGVVGSLFVQPVLGPLAIIFGGIGWARGRRGAPHLGMAMAAVVFGVVDLVVFAALLAIAVRHGAFDYAPR
jgi:diadenosine tetraphosphatase ApaH/serine/threonine PP2A family protein phosphatase